MGRKAAALRTSAKHCHFSRPHLHQQFYLFLLQALRAAFLPVVSGTVGKGLERETLCPFPRLRRFGTHYETGSKFLLLFSIKSKEEILCFAERVLNGRMTNVVQPPLSLYLDYSIKPAPHFLRLSYNSPSPFGCKIPLGLL